MKGKGASTRERIVEAAEALILAKGFAGATLEDVLAATGLTKGAFFHHFKGKAELASAVAERYLANDMALFEGFAERADRLSDDPLERALIFVRLFEEFLDGLNAPFPGCVFASYTYQAEQFAPELRDYVGRGIEAWIVLCEGRFAALVDARPPAQPVTARALAEMYASIVQGGFVVANALTDKNWTQRQLAAFRNYLELLFR